MQKCRRMPWIKGVREAFVPRGTLRVISYRIVSVAAGTFPSISLSKKEELYTSEKPRMPMKRQTERGDLVLSRDGIEHGKRRRHDSGPQRSSLVSEAPCQDEVWKGWILLTAASERPRVLPVISSQCWDDCVPTLFVFCLGRLEHTSRARRLHLE